jgi:hypothetical protein
VREEGSIGRRKVNIGRFFSTRVQRRKGINREEDYYYIFALTLPSI